MGWGSAPRPGFLYPRERPGTHCYRRLDVPQDRSGRAENLVPTGIRSRTFQPVVSRYTDWATGPTYKYISALITDLFSTKNCRLSGWFCQVRCRQTDMLKAEWSLPWHLFLPIFNMFFCIWGWTVGQFQYQLKTDIPKLILKTEKLCRPVLNEFLSHRKQNRCLS